MFAEVTRTSALARCTSLSSGGARGGGGGAAATAIFKGDNFAAILRSKW